MYFGKGYPLEEEVQENKTNEREEEEKKWASIFVTPSQPQTHKEWDWRSKREKDGKEVRGSKGAYENNHG